MKHRIDMRTIIHECKDNDNRIKFLLDDDVLDEIHVQTTGDKSWVVISMNDLLAGMSKLSDLPLISHLWLSAKNNCKEKCSCHAECHHADNLIGK